MAKQNGRRPHKAQPKTSLPIPLGAETYHRGLQNSVELFGATAQRGKVTTMFVSAQRTRGSIKVRGLGERFFKAPIRHN